MATRFPINATRQTKCPVCKSAGPGTNLPTTPRPQTATLSFAVFRSPDGKSESKPLGGELILGWDAGVSKHRLSRSSLGAAVRVARMEARRVNDGLLDVQFCSIECLRRFLMDAVDELQRRADAIGPQVEASREPTDRT